MIRKSVVLSEIPSSETEERAARACCASSYINEDVSCTIRGCAHMDESSSAEESVWKQAPSFMQFLSPSHVVMVKECGAGGDCFHRSALDGLNSNFIFDGDGDA